MKKNMIIDFTKIADTDEVSKGNPYAGSLYLNALTGFKYTVGAVSAGTLEVMPNKVEAGDEVGLPYASLLTGVFLQPVTDVTLFVGVYRNAWCYYQWVDQKGVGCKTSSKVEIQPGSTAINWQTIQLTIPAGGHLVSFQIFNRDIVPDSAAFWLKSISFNQDLHGHH